MEGYPNPDEEFELMYEDDFELLREVEEEFYGTQKSQVTSSASSRNTTVELRNVEENTGSPHISASTSVIDLDAESSNTQISKANSSSKNTRKRTIEELFGDIDDILFDNDVRYKRSKTKISDEDMIQQILELRRKAKESINPMYKKNSDNSEGIHCKNNLSYSVPKYSFVGVTRYDGARIYVRCHSEEYEKDEMKAVAMGSGFSGVMGESFKEVWKDALKYLNDCLDKQKDTSAHESLTMEVDIVEQSIEATQDLWVEKYKPKRYPELLSDESTNRTLLKWIKLWDKVVFDRKPKIKQIQQLDGQINKFLRQQELNLRLDADGRPQYKVVLICGPPGLGKTTLAHIAARQAGYNTVEINASDDCSIQNFHTAIKNATQMQSVFDKDRRPNCLIFDEIDGAPAASIEFLVKCITAVPKVQKGGKKDKSVVLRRPVICICNDAYVPALRPLRQIALVIIFPPTSSGRLAERLFEISKYQDLKTDVGALKALCEKTHNDVRSCLSALQFYKAQNKPVTLSEIYKSSVGQKDMQKGLFEVWRELFQIDRSKTRINVNGNNSAETNIDCFKARSKRIQQVVNSFGDFERLAQGVFENFPDLNIKDSDLKGTRGALEWFCFSDQLNTQIYATQNYGLNSYLLFAFVVWHFAFASLTWQKINYPTQGYEVKQKAARNEAVISEILKGMQPSRRTFVNSTSLKMDVLPYLSKIMVPTLRSVNIQYFTEEERHKIADVASIMIDYNLTYVQERMPDGRYCFITDPNIEDLVLFPGQKKVRLSDSHRHTVALEIGLQKIRRLESLHGKMDEKKGDQKQQVSSNTKAAAPKKLTATKVVKDIFGRVIEKKATNDQSVHCSSGDIWFKFKEGYSNAVRRPLKMSSLE